MCLNRRGVINWAYSSPSFEQVKGTILMGSHQPVSQVRSAPRQQWVIGRDAQGNAVHDAAQLLACASRRSAHTANDPAGNFAVVDSRGNDGT